MAPKTMDKPVEEATGGRQKKARPGRNQSDWHDTCEVCHEQQVQGKSHMLTLCSHCCRVAHKSCIERRMWGIAEKGMNGIALIVCAIWMPPPTPSAVPSVAKQIESLTSLMLGSAYSNTTSGSKGLLPPPLPRRRPRRQKCYQPRKVPKSQAFRDDTHAPRSC